MTSWDDYQNMNLDPVARAKLDAYWAGRGKTTGASPTAYTDYTRGLAESSIGTGYKFSDEDPTAYSGGVLPGASLGADATEPKSWWGEAADWAGNKNNQALVGMGLGATQVGLGLANYLQSSDFMKKQGRLLDQQIANNEYEMGRRQGFSRALADAQNQTQVG